MPVARRLPAALLLLVLIATVAINFHTARAALEFRTNVLWRDQWWYVWEWKSIQEGRHWAEVLWSPVWGHRQVVMRLLLYLDARLFALRNTPLLCLTWACLLAQIALIAGVNRAIFGSFLSWRFLVALIVTLNLCLSSFQMENLIWAFQLQWPLVFLCATLSFVLFARSERSGARKSLLAASAVSALIGSMTMVSGLLIWPVLAMQAVLGRSRRRVWLGFLGVFVVVVSIYAIGYQVPDTGMGLRGQFKRPMRALEMVLMVLGGPISNQSLAWGVAAGAAGILALGAFVFAARRERDARWLNVHIAIAVFVVLAAALTAGGRISPELVKQLLAMHGELLPSRYQTLAFVFWTSLAALSIWIAGTERPRMWKALALVACVAPGYMVIGYARMQVTAATAWVDWMHSLDATGTSMLVGAPDWERQMLLWGDRAQLESWTDFARQHRLAHFSEDRLGWLNRDWQQQFQEADAARCEGRLESVEPLPLSSARVNGWAWDRQAGKPPLDIILVDGANRIRGLGRSGLPHHDTGGHSGGVVIYRAGWLGYVKGIDSAEMMNVAAYAVLDDGRSACPLAFDFSALAR